jgi:hypothetical protein
MTLSSPSPGIAGQVNDFRVTGAHPGTVVMLVGGRNKGPTRLAEVCPTTTLRIRGHGIGNSVVDPQGNAEIRVSLSQVQPGETVHFEAIDINSCELSNLVSHQFR